MHGVAEWQGPIIGEAARAYGVGVAGGTKNRSQGAVAREGRCHGVMSKTRHARPCTTLFGARRALSRTLDLLTAIDAGSAYMLNASTILAK